MKLNKPLNKLLNLLFPYKAELKEAKANAQRAIQSANDANARLELRIRELEEMVEY